MRELGGGGAAALVSRASQIHGPYDAGSLGLDFVWTQPKPGVRHWHTMMPPTSAAKTY